VSEVSDKTTRNERFHGIHRPGHWHLRSSSLIQLERSIADLNELMDQLEREFSSPPVDKDWLADRLTWQIRATEGVARAVEGELAGDRVALKRVQAEFRQKTDRHFAKSYFMNRARAWPRGYPGDYRIIDQTYDNQPLSEGVGDLLDRYFLSSTLAESIRWRRLKMRDILAREMNARKSPRVLNIGCGPCREVLELAPVIAGTNAFFTCIDFDDEALAYSASRMAATPAATQCEFRRYNALKMIHAARNLAVFGARDIIYTIGLLDYLTDAVLVRMIRALFETLKPGGVFVAVFKDSERYQTQDYHWLVDWTGFHQRTAVESRRLIEQAGIPSELVTTERSRCEVMVFYRILHAAQLNAAVPAPHLGAGQRRRAAGRFGVRSE
jgi:extracellular factor (EF) 3-hydroxypalmitic acid methyl ester biosynthesis protein